MTTFLFWNVNNRPVVHGIELYPLKASAGSPWKELNSEQEFLDWLRQALSSERTKGVIAALVAQSKS